MVELLISSDVAKYCEFRTVSRVLTLLNGKLEQVSVNTNLDSLLIFLSRYFKNFLFLTWSLLDCDLEVKNSFSLFLILL